MDKLIEECYKLLLSEGSTVQLQELFCVAASHYDASREDVERWCAVQSAQDRFKLVYSGCNCYLVTPQT